MTKNIGEASRIIGDQCRILEDKQREVNIREALRKRGSTMVKQGKLRPVKRSSLKNDPELLRDEQVMQCIEDLCNSKAEEFRLYGYEDVTGEQVWACVSESYRRGWPRLNRLVNDIMSLKANRFMNWLMLSVYKQ